MSAKRKLHRKNLCKTCEHCTHVGRSAALGLSRCRRDSTYEFYPLFKKNTRSCPFYNKKEEKE